VAQLLSFAGGSTQTAEERHRITLFPIYFQQRSSNPEDNYTAIGPFYGRLQNRLFRDDIHYVMFPFYSRTRKRDVVTANYVYPIFHLRRGDGLSGWQFWPLYGWEHKAVTTLTNGFGDVEVVGGHRRRFVLWPFFADQYAGLGTENPDHQQALLPFYNFQRSPKRDMTTVLWPFFSKIEDREKRYTEWHAPWPFIIAASGEGKTISRFWPFYSHARSTNQQSDFFMWPLYRYTRLHTASIDRERRRVLFFLYSDKPGNGHDAPAPGFAALFHVAARLPEQHAPSGAGAARTGAAGQPEGRTGIFAGLVGVALGSEPGNRRQQPIVIVESVSPRDPA
jgi:hypothetical protein